MTPEKFQAMIAEDELLEYNHYAGDYGIAGG